MHYFFSVNFEAVMYKNLHTMKNKKKLVLIKAKSILYESKRNYLKSKCYMVRLKIKFKIEQKSEALSDVPFIFNHSRLQKTLKTGRVLLRWRPLSRRPVPLMERLT